MMTYYAREPFLWFQTGDVVDNPDPSWIEKMHVEELEELKEVSTETAPMVEEEKPVEKPVEKKPTKKKWKK